MVIQGIINGGSEILDVLKVELTGFSDNWRIKDECTVFRLSKFKDGVTFTEMGNTMEGSVRRYIFHLEYIEFKLSEWRCQIAVG